MKKSTLAKRLDRVEAAIFGQATDGAGDDMGLSVECAPPPTQADGRMGAEVVMDAIKGRSPAPDADTIAWACERALTLAEILKVGRDNTGLKPDICARWANEMHEVADRLSGGADGGLL